MKIKYQGNDAETDATTVMAFLESRGVKTGEIVAEYEGGILSGKTAFATPLEEGAELNVFRIVAGG